jgi:hypothetical protein
MSAVYANNFMLTAVENQQHTLLDQTMQATLHAIHHSLFQMPSVNDPPGTKDLILEKKLQKGDARWDPIKEVLRYELNKTECMVQLQAAKPDALLKEL